VTGSGELLYYVEEMASELSLGEFEQIVILAAMRIGDEAYAVTILKEIEECTGREPSVGALYTTIDRLLEKGLLTSRMGDPTPERGGRAKRYIQVTPAAVRAVARAQRGFRRLTQGLSLPGVGNA
jgi:DNA-binding PadR family transcriptional regulator